MKKLLFALMAVVAMNLVSCKKTNSEPDSPTKKADTTIVAEDLVYRVTCSPAVFKIMDVKLEYIAFPDSNDIKTVAITDNWNSAVYNAASGTFGMRLTCTPKEELNITDDLFDENNGAYLFLEYGMRNTYKEGYQDEFWYNKFLTIDLRGKIKYKDRYTKENIGKFSDAVAYSFNYNPETGLISQFTIRDFWSRH